MDEVLVIGRALNSYSRDGRRLSGIAPEVPSADCKVIVTRDAQGLRRAVHRPATTGGVPAPARWARSCSSPRTTGRPRWSMSRARRRTDQRATRTGGRTDPLPHRIPPALHSAARRERPEDVER
jgi:hypothetical protein